MTLQAGFTTVQSVGSTFDKSDFCWFFMGTKRKENYDNWWRCEIRFDPEADELFGVTHTKQRISPAETLNAVLSDDLERIAHQLHELNALVRKVYFSVKGEDAVPQVSSLPGRKMFCCLR